MRLSLADVDLSLLTERERATLEAIADDAEGPDAPSAADVDALQARLLALSGASPLPDLADDEFEALKLSIAAHGQQLPIFRSAETGEIVDGRARRRACAQLGIEPWIQNVPAETAEQRRCLGLALNLARRQMASGPRRAVVRAELVRDASRSDRAIAAACGVSDKTVAAVRRELEHGAEIPHQPVRVGADGVEQPVRERQAEPPAERAVRVLVPSGTFEQYVGDWVACAAFRLVERRQNVYELQVQHVDVAPVADAQVAELVERTQAVAEALDVAALDVTRDLLANVREVFGRSEAVNLNLLTEQEADWALGQLSILAGAVAA
jgi:ParB-like chromosome segregation protein Spo0J